MPEGKGGEKKEKGEREEERRRGNRKTGKSRDVAAWQNALAHTSLSIMLKLQRHCS